MVLPIIITTIVLTVFFLGFVLIGYLVHKDMVVNRCDEYGFGSFEDFKREYNKITWEQHYPYKFSHFGVDRYPENKIHASILEFNGVGMILDFKSWIKFRVWSFRNRMGRSSVGKFNDIVIDKLKDYGTRR